VGVGGGSVRGQAANELSDQDKIGFKCSKLVLSGACLGALEHTCDKK
jgi:hypothetical protein